MNSKKGFPLVEILVVVIIIGILAAIVLPQFFDKELQEYSTVIRYIRSNYCVKIEYSQLGSSEIYLTREDGSLEFFKLNSEYFLELKEMLKKGGDLGTWTFELVVTDPPGAPDSLVWHGTRKPGEKSSKD